jgi:hypothetical protein
MGNMMVTATIKFSLTPSSWSWIEKVAVVAVVVAVAVLMAMMAMMAAVAVSEAGRAARLVIVHWY